MSALRDNFTEQTKRLLAARVSYRCSNPNCRTATIGPGSQPDSFINLGTAAHICAASPGGKRYDNTMTAEERSNAANGIWLCTRCGKLIDSDEEQFTVKLLHDWREKSERAAIRESQSGRLVIPADALPLLEDLDGNPLQLRAAGRVETLAELSARAHTAAVADIALFKAGPAWPSPAVQLSLTGTDDKGRFDIADLAKAIRAGRELSIVAQPGTGKTTTLIQAAENILATGQETVAFIPLGNWSKDNCGLLAAVAKRAPFTGISEQDLLSLASNDRLTLLLDGWNELDQTARDRAFAEIERLQREYPLLRIVISTRRQAMDLPIAGQTVEVQPFSNEQQLVIARAIAGAAGEQILDSAWRTPGLRELVAIPLYLRALISNRSGVMPTTREEVLRLFIDGHEKKPIHATAFDGVIHGIQHKVLTGLGVEATATANTSIADARAKAVVSGVERRLYEDGELVDLSPQPRTVLDVLVNHHVIVRQGGDAIGFQHQQFQEWYASFEVEAVMLGSSRGDYEANRRLIAEILNMPSWEEAVLFACERLSRRGDDDQKSVAAAIVETLSIDPMLAADMISRSTEAVWVMVRDDVLGFAARWHKPGKIDRAIRFMVTTGRAEFSEQIWPFLSDKENQRHIRVLREAARFRPSVLGPDAEQRLLALPDDVRPNVLGEIASNSGIDGMELAAKVAQADPLVEVQAEVVGSLVFRRGDRLAKEILQAGSDDLWKAVARSYRSRDFTDPDVAARIRNERLEIAKEPKDPIRAFTLLVDSDDDGGGVPEEQANIEAAIADMLSGPDFPIRDQHVAWAIDQAFKKYPKAVQSALVHRLENGLPLPFRSGDYFADAPLVDDGPITDILFASPERSEPAAIAAGMSGTETIAKLLDIALELVAKTTRGRRLSKDESVEYIAIRDRLKMVRISPLLEAWLERTNTEKPEEITLLAETLSGFGDMDTRDATLPLDEPSGERVVAILRRWCGLLCADKDSQRQQLAELATAIGRLGKIELLDCLTALLDEDLARRAELLAQFIKSGGRVSPGHDPRMVYGLQYRRAFALLGGQETQQALTKYLPHPEFGPEAANAIKDIFERKHQPKAKDGMPVWGPDFSKVAERQQQVADGVARADTDAAAMIFEAVIQLSHPANSEKEHQLALVLARIATFLPHRRRPELTESLLALPVSWASKQGYFLALVLSGETPSADMLLDGIREFFEEAKSKTWLLDHEAPALRQWLTLLPFSDRPNALFEALDIIAQQLEAWRLQQILRTVSPAIVRNLSLARSPEAEQDLFALGERDPRLYGEHEWATAVLKRETESGHIRLFELADGKPEIMGHLGGFHFEAPLRAFIDKKPAFRAELLRRYKAGDFKRANGPVEKVLMKTADSETVIVLFDRYAAQGHKRVGELRIAIESAVLEHRDVPGWSGSYEIHGKAAPELRKELFARTQGPNAELAADCLTLIDRLRDEHGRVTFEPRHPDIESNLPWPLEARPLHADEQAP